MINDSDARAPLIGGELFAVDMSVYDEMRAINTSYSEDPRCFDTREFVYVEEK